MAVPRHRQRQCGQVSSFGSCFVSLLGRGVRMHPLLADDQPVRGDQVGHLSVFLLVRLTKVGGVDCKRMHEDHASAGWVSRRSVVQTGHIRHPRLTPVTRFGGQPKRGSLVSLHIHEWAAPRVKGLRGWNKAACPLLEAHEPTRNHRERASSCNLVFKFDQPHVSSSIPTSGILPGP
ncbi:hypothetical protein F5144DRAFT_265187 [Chaetomium tenue]|uniref:Uncharacterized protein n=1 Tax=Chaetomium tenue TaxID=1854479 RepID=A0ACB7PBP1_9PEZI|nr:hypothetical protein F5144DRAFT_265187 [Chaetomium globosum]